MTQPPQSSVFLRISLINILKCTVFSAVHFCRFHLIFYLFYKSIRFICKKMLFSNKGRGSNLTERLSTSLASCFLRRGWIRSEDIPYCKYMLDGFIGKSTFFLLLLAVCSIFHCYKEALSFCFVLLSFRRRMGGWHANSRLLCQVLSISSVLLVCLFVGPILSKAAPWIIVSINSSLIIISFFLPPAYPPQLHFTDEEATANLRKKNLFLVTLIIVQGLLIFIFNLKILVYSSLGLCLGIISVIMERTTKKIGKDKRNEKHG